MSDETTPASAGRRFGVGALIATGVVAFAIAAVAGYLLGHSEGEDSGQASGKSAGEAAIEAKYRPGEPAYQAIYDEGHKAGRAEGLKAGLARGTRAGLRRGQREGKKVGWQEGERVGLKSGEEKGIAEGASAALGGISDWTAGGLYVVAVEKGDGVPYVITKRHLMEPNVDYKLCESNPQEVCSAPRVRATSE